MGCTGTMERGVTEGKAGGGHTSNTSRGARCRQGGVGRGKYVILRHFRLNLSLFGGLEEFVFESSRGHKPIIHNAWGILDKAFFVCSNDTFF